MSRDLNDILIDGSFTVACAIVIGIAISIGGSAVYVFGYLLGWW